MNFVEAINLGLINGKTIRRAAWYDKAYIKRDNLYFRLFFATENEEFGAKYNPDNCDILANDWEIYEQKPVTFPQAFKNLKNGKRIKRASQNITYQNTGNFAEIKPSICKQCIAGKYECINKDEAIFSCEDIDAIDWIILD